MKVIACKAVGTDVSYGSTETVEVLKFENVTSITYSGGATPSYGITHQTGNDASSHTTNLDAKQYILNIVPMREGG